MQQSAAGPLKPPPTPPEVQRTRNTTNNLANTLCDMATVFCTLKASTCTIRYPHRTAPNLALQGRISHLFRSAVRISHDFLVFKLYDSAVGERTTRMIFRYGGQWAAQRNGYNMYDGWMGLMVYFADLLICRICMDMNRSTLEQCRLDGKMYRRLELGWTG